MNIILSSLHYQSSLICSIRYFASKMQAGSTKNKKDSAGRRLGIKKFGGQAVFPNDIIARQRGLKWKPGDNVRVGKDHTIKSKIEGVVQFRQHPYRIKHHLMIDVIPKEGKCTGKYNPKPYIYHP